MTLWTWVLVALSAAGVVMAVVASIPVVTSLRRVRTRVEELQHSPLASSLRGLPYEGARLSASAEQLNALATRAETAVSSIQQSADGFRLGEATRALQSAGEEIAALIEVLR